MKCWNKQKIETDPYYTLDDRLIRQVCHSADGFEELTEDERSYYTVRILINEVLNGGFHQYFYNQSGSRHLYAEAALERTNELEARDLLKESREALFPGVAVPQGVMDRRRTIPFAFESPGSNWPEMARREDSRFTCISGALEATLKKFARDAGLVPADAVYPSSRP